MRLKCFVQGHARGGASPRIAVQVDIVDAATGDPPAGFRRLDFEVPAISNFEDFEFSFEVEPPQAKAAAGRPARKPRRGAKP